MKPVRLYDLGTGMNPRRVRIFMAEKGIVLPRVEIDMMKGENKLPDYLAKNPMGTMPLLELEDGSFLAESVAICRYLEALHPEPPLFGRTPLEQARIEMWNRRMELEIMRPVQDGFVHTASLWVGRRTQFPEYGRHMQSQAFERMAWLDRELRNRPYVAGDAYTIADITAQAALLLGKNTGAPIPPELLALQRWWKSVTGRPTARA